MAILGRSSPLSPVSKETQVAQKAWWGGRVRDFRV